jgi:hypothetical protein
LGITLISPAAVFDGVCRKDLEFAWGIYLADSCSLPRKTNPQRPQYMNAIDVNKDPVKADSGWLWRYVIPNGTYHFPRAVEEGHISRTTPP